MQSRRVVVLVNPAAGKGHAARQATLVQRRLRERGVTVDRVDGSDSLDSAERLTAQLRRPCDAVVACGGDGTIHLALQQLVGTDVALGVVAAGTGNDTAELLGIPQDPIAAADVVVDALAREPVRIDVGLATTAMGIHRHFLAVLSSGFDSLVNERANTMSWPPGRAKYLASILAELRVFRPVDYDVVLDEGLPSEKSFQRSGMLVAVGNGRSYGGGMKVCPEASVTDGQLSVTFVSKLSTPAFLRVFPKVFSGQHLGHPAVQTYLATTVRLTAPDQVAYADGERVGPLPVLVRAVPKGVRVLAPNSMGE